MKLQSARNFANISILIFFIFVSIMTTLHIVMPEFNPLIRTMSEYVTGAYGELMVVAFMVLAVGVGTVAFALYNALEKSLRSQLVFLIFAQASFGFFIAGIFPTDLIDAEATMTGIIHDITSFMGILGVPIALILILRKLRNVEQWQDYYQTASKICVATLIWFFIWNPFLANANLEGFGQRIFACLLLVWLLYTCFYIRHLNRSIQMR